MRKGHFTVVMAFLAVFCIVSAAVAEDITDKLSITGEIRARVEGDNRDFRGDTKLYSFGLLRTRVGLGVQMNPHVRAFVQIQDSRQIGENLLGSGSLQDDKNLGLHQGYFYADSIFVRQLYMQVGRFEFAKGDQRVFGAVDWSNIGRTWDGALLGFRHGRVDAQLFGFIQNERRIESNDDLQTFGLYTTIEEPSIDFFFVWDRDNRTNSDSKRYLDRFTVGLYRHGEFADFDYTSNLAYQFGNINFDAMDIAAYLVTLEIGYSPQLVSPRASRAALGADIASGDDKSDDKYKVYDNLYYTGHKFRGHMDYFVSSAMPGLNDFYLTTMFRPISTTSINLHAHYFMANVDYNSLVDGAKTSAVGEEIDLFFTHKLHENLAIQLGGSMFFPSDDWRGQGADPAHWLYLQMTASF
jgi:hypothetical protein